MKFYPVEPRSEEWQKRRLGIATSSNFERIITKGGRPSKQRTDYLHKLLSEWYLGHALEDVQTQYMIRGQELEFEAISRVEFEMDLETSLGGLITDDAGVYACSPDRLIGEDGILEIKCPSAPVMIGHMLEDDLSESHFVQVMGQLFVSSRKYVTIAAYHPELPLCIKRVERDEDYITLLAAEVNKFVADMLAARDLLESKYGPPRKPEEQAGPDLSKHELTEEDAEAIIRHHFPL